MTPVISVMIVDGVVDPARLPTVATGAGAVVDFRGVVRPDENGEQISALKYETYDPMAQQQMERLAREIANRHRLLALHVVHSRGEVAVGDVSMIVRACGVHRAETLAGVGEFVDELKKDVPIWKHVVGTCA